MARFTDRRSAGQELGAALRGHQLVDPVVMAIPRGGVPVAAAIAEVLGTRLGLLDVHEVSAHRQDLGLGAVQSSGEHSVRESTAKALGVDHDELEEKLDAERAGLAALLAKVWPTGAVQPMVNGAAIVVDDGLLVAGAAAMAADQVRAKGASAVILAVPVGVTAFVDAAVESFDDVVCLERAPGHTELEEWYESLPPVTDEQIIAAVHALDNEM